MSTLSLARNLWYGRCCCCCCFPEVGAPLLPAAALPGGRAKRQMVLRNSWPWRVTLGDE